MDLKYKQEIIDKSFMQESSSKTTQPCIPKSEFCDISAGENKPKFIHFEAMDDLNVPLNLSPNPSLGPNKEAKSLPNMSPILGTESPSCQQSNLSSFQSFTPPYSWPGLCRTPYFFPPLQFPFLYPPASDSPTNSSSTTPPSFDPKTDEELTGKTAVSSPKSGNAAKCKEIVTNGSNYISSFNNDSKACDHYQVKWSNHASRLSSFISSLRGDVTSSDTVISVKDGTTFYAHRLVLASASPFFSRTLKTIPRDQHAGIVIPRASSRCIETILSFCYTGRVIFPTEDLKSVLELAEDLEITGLLAEKEKQSFIPPRSQPSPSSVFTFTPPSSFATDNYRENCGIPSLPLAERPPAFSPGPASAPFWKREQESHLDYAPPPLKRIKSESDVQNKSSKKGSKSKNAENGLNLQSIPTCLQSAFTAYSSNQASSQNDYPDLLSDSSGSEPQTPAGIIPRPVGTGSRVLLWRFLLQILHDKRYAPYYIRWLNRSKGIFRIMESDKVAQLWGMARKNKNMTYEKMSRGMRTYYKRSILFHLDGTKLIYRFNIDDPEIQHQLRYYELMGQKYDDETLHYRNSAPPSTSEQDVSTSSPERFNSPSTSKNLTYGRTPSTTMIPSVVPDVTATAAQIPPMSPQLMPEMSQNLFNINSLFPSSES